ncbi:MAG: CRISPR-associated protein Cas4 [Candidatus Woesearchaeota archaeon]|nr:CRISPR-associated protein Cas4 [Candidatus Woesearchaeota archaeon]
MLSVSMLSGYLYCKRKLYLQYVLHLAEPKKESLVLGTIRHKIFEEINNAEEKIVRAITKEDDHEKIVSRYKEEYLEIVEKTIKKKKKDIAKLNIPESDVLDSVKDSVMNEAEERAGNVHDFVQKNKNMIFGEELWEKLTPKILSEFCISSESLGLRGIIDKVEIYDNIIVPVELKTGKCPEEGGWPSHELQLHAYMALLSGKQRSVKEGKLVYLDAGKVIRLPNNPFVEVRSTPINALPAALKTSAMTMNS